MKTTMKQKRTQYQLTMSSGVCKLLELNPDQLNQMMFDMGCEYVEKMVDSQMAHEFLTEPMFWNWWRQQWALIDEAFIRQAAQAPLSRQTMRRWYAKHHRSIDVYPDDIIWEKIHNSYQDMVTKVIEKHTS